MATMRKPYASETVENFNFWQYSEKKVLF